MDRPQDRSVERSAVDPASVPRGERAGAVEVDSATVLRYRPDLEDSIGLFI